MAILDEILGFFRKPREPRVAEPAEPAEPTCIKLVIDLIAIHETRHQGPGIYGYSWEENAAIGVMNTLVAAGIPMDWTHFIQWRNQNQRFDALAFERFMPSRGRITVTRDFDFTYRGMLHVTWKA